MTWTWVAVLVGAALWFLGVVLPNPQSGQYEYFFWLMSAAAIALGWLEKKPRAAAIGPALAAVPLLTAWWAAPRGDDEGLWLLVFPLLVASALLNAALAMVGQWLHRRVSDDANRRSAPS